MKELWERLWIDRRVGQEICIASAVINVLALTSALYSGQVMNRYLALGIDATLLTLSVGAMLAVGFELVLRSARARLTHWSASRSDQKLGAAAVHAITQARYAAFEQVPAQSRREALGGLSTIQQAFGGAALVGLADAPFALIFLIVLGLISPTLMVWSVLAIGVVTALSVIASKASVEPGAEQAKLSVQLAGTAHTLASSGELVRAFRADAPLAAAWQATTAQLDALRSKVAELQNFGQNVAYAGSTVLGMMMMGLGAREVFAGTLDAGSLIAANILAVRALSSISRFLQVRDGLNKGMRAIEQLAVIAKLPRERTDGTSPAKFDGVIRFEDFAFSYPRQPMPIYEHFEFTIPAGGVIAVIGPNGSGKTTLARLLAGLLEPTRGRMLADGMDQRQLAPPWWRQQVGYLPQEPKFLDGSLRDNLKVTAPQLDDAGMLALIREVGLSDYVEGHPDGLGMMLRNNAESIPVGVRRRLALARALAGRPQLIVLDEPTEGLDPQGCKAIADVLNRLVAEQRTIVVMTQEPFIVAAAQATIDLSSKPTPKVVMAKRQPDATPAAASARPPSGSTSATASGTASQEPTLIKLPGLGDACAADGHGLRQAQPERKAHDQSASTTVVSTTSNEEPQV